MSDPRHFLVNLSYQPGREFMQALLETGEFSANLLRAVGVARPTKHEGAGALCDKLWATPALADEVLLRLCRTPRTWLYLALLPQGATARPSNASASAWSFLTEFGAKKQWYGPFSGVEDPDVSWYVRTQAVPHYIEEASFEGEDKPTMTRVAVRWHVVAMVGSGYVALHWHNFNHLEKGDHAGQSGEQFPYWEHIPEIRQELLEIVGLGNVAVEEPALNDLVLNKLIEKYEPDPEFEWKHLRVRAEQYGVAMNARSASAKVSEHDIGGLRKLTTALAESAAGALGHDGNDEKVSQIERSLLRTFIREWGTLSYEFELNKTSGEKVFRGHVYFGEREKNAGPDSLTHCKCLQQWGGSRRVLSFILEHL